MEKLNVLITGMGGPLGMSVFKALLMSQLPVNIIGTDISARSYGLYLVDKAYILPHSRKDPKSYLNALCEIVKKDNVNVIFPCSEDEMIALSMNLDLFAQFNCSISVPLPHLIEKVMDKYLLNQELLKGGFLVPDSIIPTSKEIDDFLKVHGYPVILKARRDSGSRHLFRIQNHDELEFFSRYVKDPIIQELLLPDDEEYTVGVFIAPEERGEGTIILKRELAAGLTFKAEVVHNELIADTCLRAVKYLGLVGPNNVQLRLTEEGPKIFEINPRFSSTTVIRAFYGFNEPELFIRAMVLKEEVYPTHASSGVALRMWDELYVDTKVVNNLEKRRIGSNLNFSAGIHLGQINRRRSKRP